MRCRIPHGQGCTEARGKDVVTVGCLTSTAWQHVLFKATIDLVVVRRAQGLFVKGRALKHDAARMGKGAKVENTQMRKRYVVVQVGPRTRPECRAVANVNMTSLDK